MRVLVSSVVCDRRVRNRLVPVGLAGVPVSQLKHSRGGQRQRTHEDCYLDK